MVNLMQILAQSEKIDPSSIGIKNPVKNADAALTGLLNTIYTWAGILCVMVIIVAAYLYVMSSGNATNTKRAKDAILGAVIGLIIIIMAFTITQYVIGRF
jgi:hypothetical protein